MTVHHGIGKLQVQGYVPWDMPDDDDSDRSWAEPSNDVLGTVGKKLLYGSAT
jgi:hypothetical protein